MTSHAPLKLPAGTLARRARSLALTGAVAITTTSCASAPASTAAARATPPSREPSTSAPSTSRADLGIVNTRPGSGARAASGQCLYVHYVGVLADGRTFESSSAPQANGQLPSPIAFELGLSSVMSGWEKGLLGMQVGGARRLFVPYRMAYGASGRPPAIPPRTDLVFDIELMAVAPSLPTSSNAPRAETARTCPTWASVNRAR